MSETYTIHMRDETFYLTRDQIDFDSPNYFTSCFLGDFAESQTRTLRLSRDPDLFKIVLDYLSGYHVLPLVESVIPKRMDRELALRNLRVDADFYLLNGLVTQLAGTRVAPPGSTSARFDYVVISGDNRSWGEPAYLDTQSVTALQAKHGVEMEIQYAWGSHRPRIEEALRKAGITRSFAVYVSWKEVDIYGATSYCAVLNIS